MHLRDRCCWSYLLRPGPKAGIPQGRRGGVCLQYFSGVEVDSGGCGRKVQMRTIRYLLSPSKILTSMD